MPTLFDDATPTLRARFLEFHGQHPEVYELFRDYAHKARNAGMTRYGAWPIMARIRWFHHIEKGDRDWTINNDFTALYARMLIENDATFATFFELRVMKRA